MLLPQLRSLFLPFRCSSPLRSAPRSVFTGLCPNLHQLHSLYPRTSTTFILASCYALPPFIVSFFLPPGLLMCDDELTFAYALSRRFRVGPESVFAVELALRASRFGGCLGAADLHPRGKPKAAQSMGRALLARTCLPCRSATIPCVCVCACVPHVCGAAFDEYRRTSVVCELISLGVPRRDT